MKIQEYALLKNCLLIFLLFTVCPIVRAQQSTAAGSLAGLRIGVIGDSYVRNHRQPVEQTWHYKFARKHGMQYHNFGINGNCLAFTRTDSFKDPGVFIRYASMPDSLDYIVVIGGHNDAALLDSLGGIELFRENFAELCRGLVEKFPVARIFFFTCWSTDHFAGSNTEKVVDAMVEICGDYSIPVFDSARNSGIYAYSEPFRRQFFQRYTDKAHLNGKGHDRFLPVAESFLLKYVENQP